jgi:enoyl-CoA hydratase/carnithine racemase
MITQDVEDRIATVTIRRPEKLNSLRAEDKQAIATHIAELSDRSDVDAIVLTGDGDRAFCAGSDINQMRHFGVGEMHTMLAAERAMYVAALRAPKPVVAAVNGYALGAGMILTMATDYSVAAATAQFGTPELSIGVAAPLEGLLLPALVGLARARELFYLGKRVDAETAQGMGLINEVVPPEDLHTRATEVATQIGSLPSDGFRVQKSLLYRLVSNGDLEGAIVESH